MLNELGIITAFVSRTPTADNQLSYDELNENILASFLLIVNTTPLGTFPKVDEKPIINYDAITPNHLLYDLVYNPVETAFLKERKKRGALTINGEQMLQLQAEKAWEIWGGRNR